MVQQAWLRSARADARAIAALPAWLTTVVTRSCLDRLRGRGTAAAGPTSRDERFGHTSRRPLVISVRRRAPASLGRGGSTPSRR